LLSDDRYYRGTVALFAEKPDPVAAEHLFRQAVELYPRAFWVFIELGNIYLSRGSRDEALRAYAAARDSTPAGSVFLRPIEDQIRLLSTTAPLSQIAPVRDPSLE
jgi:tetratricopeptide (TPR) repeat protein